MRTGVASFDFDLEEEDEEATEEVGGNLIFFGIELTGIGLILRREGREDLIIKKW